MLKCISAPFIENKTAIDGTMTSPDWEKADTFDDFQLYMHEGSPVTAETEVRLLHDGEALYIGVICKEEKGKIKPGNDFKNFAGTDRIEFFLGALEPQPCIIQYAIAPGGMIYSGDGDDKGWQSAYAIREDAWTAEIRIPFTKFRQNNMTTLFNICRYRVHAAEQQVWAEVGADFQTVSRFGEICFDSYNAAAKAKFQHFTNAPLNRGQYAELCELKTTPPHELAHGPWLYDPSCTSMTVGWANAGGSPAALEYRKKGEDDVNVVYSHYSAGVWDKARKLHKVRLDFLEPDTEYEYRIRNYMPDGTNFVTRPENSFLSFRTPYSNADSCRFLIFTDVHNKKHTLKNFIEKCRQMENCDFIINMGDMITNSNGDIPVFEGYLDAQTDFVSRRPMFNLRGNHENRGLLPTGYVELFGHAEGNPYFMYRHGKLCIIGVDGGEDYLNRFNIPYIDEENAWLKEIVQSEAFLTAEKRILLSHMPLLEEGKYSKVMQRLLDGVFIGQNPMAKIDVMLCGHTHRASYTEPDSDTFTCFFTDGTETRKCIPVPFATICNAGPDKREPGFSALYVQFDKGRLTVDILMTGCEKPLKSFVFE